MTSPSEDDGPVTRNPVFLELLTENKRLQVELERALASIGLLNRQIMLEREHANVVINTYNRLSEKIPSSRPPDRT